MSLKYVHGALAAVWSIAAVVYPTRHHWHLDWILFCVVALAMALVFADEAVRLHRQDKSSKEQ